MGFLHFAILGTLVISWWLMDDARKDRFMLHPYSCFKGGEWHRVFSHAFIHADWVHLGFNMFVLYEFGTTVEQDLHFLGWLGMPSLYLAGILGGALPALRRHRGNPSYRSLGASGAVSAVLLAFICLHPTRTLLLFFVIPIPAFFAGVLFFWYEGRMQAKGHSRIAHDAHIGGAIVGTIWAFVAVPGTLTQYLESLWTFLG